MTPARTAAAQKESAEGHQENGEGDDEGGPGCGGMLGSTPAEAQRVLATPRCDCVEAGHGCFGKLQGAHEGGGAGPQPRESGHRLRDGERPRQAALPVAGIRQ